MALIRYICPTVDITIRIEERIEVLSTKVCVASIMYLNIQFIKQRKLAFRTVSLIIFGALLIICIWSEDWTRNQKDII